MKNNKLLIIPLLLAAIFISNNVFSRCMPDKHFPLRTVFLMVDCINIDSFIKQTDANELLVVDARTETEYQIIHIKDSINISIEDNKKFIKQLKKLRRYEQRPIVFYCNGKNCNISYRAAQLANNSGINNTFVFDGGIFEYSQNKPENTILLNNPISGINALISKKEFKQHLLSVAQFNRKISDKLHSGEKFNVLDIRTKANRMGVSAFVGIPYNKSISIKQSDKIKHYLNNIAKDNNTLFVYDWSGKQLKWIQYYIEDQHIEHYYFLKGGAAAKINRELKEQGLPEMSWLTIR